MQSGTPQTARETIVAHVRRHHLSGTGAQYFDALIAGYDAELESFERSVASMKAELARLATQKAENLPDGSRRFRYGNPDWEWRIALNPPSLARNKGDGFGWHDIDAGGPDAPPLGILAEQFAKLGREVGFAQKIDSLESATRERIAALEDERDQARKHHSHEYQNRIELQGRIAELDAQLADEKWKSGGIEADREQVRRVAHAAERLVEILKGKIRDLEQTERDSRAEVASLIEGDGRAECADVEMTAVYDVGNSGGYEPHVRLYVRRGDRIYILAEDRGRYDRQTGAELSPPNREWVQLPPLPPIEPAKAGAEAREPAPPDLARHDWHTHRGHVSCERCGAPFSEGLKDHACGAQP